MKVSKMFFQKWFLHVPIWTTRYEAKCSSWFLPTNKWMTAPLVNPPEITHDRLCATSSMGGFTKFDFQKHLRNLYSSIFPLNYLFLNVFSNQNLSFFGSISMHFPREVWGIFSRKFRGPSISQAGETQGIFTHLRPRNFCWWPFFGGGENVTLWMVVGDLQMGNQKVSNWITWKFLCYRKFEDCKTLIYTCYLFIASAFYDVWLWYFEF